MTKQHKALELADAYAEACFTQGLHHRLADPESKKCRAKLEAEIERQHALIVQMREALDQCVNWIDEAAPHYVSTEARAASADADQYLEQP